MDVSDLRGAYERFFRTAAAAAGCATADDEGWTVPMVVAHITANDRLLISHLRRAIDGGPTSYGNLDVYRGVDLRPLVERTPRTTDLIADGRRVADELLAVAASLDEARAALAFRTTILDGEVVQVDADVPLAGLLGALVHVHLPVHIAQIEALAAA